MYWFLGMKTKRPVIELTPTPRDQILDMAGWVFLALLWAIIAISYGSLPDTIPTHFGASGQPDAFGPKATILGLPALGTAIFGGMTLLNRYPHLFNYPVNITEENALAHYTHATRMIRFIKVSVILTFTLVVWEIIRHARGQTGLSGGLFMAIVLGLVVAPVLWFTIRAYRTN
jgi:uncharacterized membrane protein